MGIVTVDLAIQTAVIAGAAFVLWRVLQPRYDVRIVLTPEGVQRLEGVAKRAQREVEEFLAQNLPDSGKVVVGGIRQPGGRLRLVFRGPIDRGQQQRFRNFFSLPL